MVRYQITPGVAAIPPSRMGEQIQAPKGHLLLFLHPQCGCSMATVDELQRTLSKTQLALATTIYFYKPRNEPASWCTGTRLWNEAKLIPNAKVIIDSDGQAAKKFGARCSGQILIYAPKSGSLVFSGGITESRGHEGESRGGDAIIEFAKTGTCSIHKTNVFGCAIW